MIRVLFIGGTGVISSACTKAAIEKGYDVTLLLRGLTHREIPEQAKIIHADYRDFKAVEKVLNDQPRFDVVVDWIAYTPEQVKFDIELFQGKTSQYIFISSASVYQTPPAILPITESTPLSNPYWHYSQQKIACEELLQQAGKEGFPVTIVRPSHTYDCSKVFLPGGFTTLSRMKNGKKVIIFGDGTSLWTLTHHRDFAAGFTGLLGNHQAIGEAFHITSDNFTSWNQIFEIFAEILNKPLNAVHVTSDTIAAFDPEWAAGWLGDKSISLIFDNSKIKRIVPDFTAKIPLSTGVREMISWHEQNADKTKIDPQLDQLLDQIISVQEGIIKAAQP